MPKAKRGPKKSYEDIYTKQVSDFMETHGHIIEEEGDIFQMAKNFEERYDFVISTAKQQMDDEIAEIKIRNDKFSEQLINEHQNRLLEDFQNLKLDIELTLEEHEVKVDIQMKVLEDLYKKNKKKLLDEGIKELGLGF
ncbi:MAG: hypothetical protein EU530_04560 [Promethearchaeota archaeon]|nr:MAG: hypothetical protein EU530_04560 [Candidatus Lokiarchaeota archaeon]